MAVIKYGSSIYPDDESLEKGGIFKKDNVSYVFKCAYI